MRTDQAGVSERFSLEVEDLPANSTRVLSFEGSEGTNELYSLDVLVVLRELDPHALEQCLGRRVSFRVKGSARSEQHTHGVIGGISAEGYRHGVEACYAVRVVPTLWLAGLRETCRIFQDRSIAEIVETVLASYRIATRWELSESSTKRAYCVQHHESDLAFVERLLAEEGIAYRFEHPAVSPTNDRTWEVVVLSDSCDAKLMIDGDPRLVLREALADGALASDDSVVRELRSRRKLAPTQALLRDYDFARPLLEQRSLSAPLRRVYSPTHDGALPATAGVYEHRLGYLEPPLDARDARRHLEQLQRRSETYDGSSHCNRLRPGTHFHLVDESARREDGTFRVLRVEHQGRIPELAGSDDTYENRFVATDVGVPDRPARRARALRQVTETALVVGPAGEEIYADELGRVKVRFHWDLDRERPEESASCWLRVALPWAGASWGFQFVPRIGMEVVVSFLGGDLDRPMITGCVYNGVAPPPFAIPSEVTRSGMKTRSTPGGDGYNELSFEDAKGREQIRLHAERNLDEVVNLDHSTAVGRDQTLRVEGAQSTHVEVAQSVSVMGSRTLLVGQDHSIRTDGSHLETVAGDRQVGVKGNDAHSVAGEYSREVGADATVLIRGALSESVEGTASQHIGTADLPSDGEVYAFGSYLLGAAGAVRIRSERSVVLECGDSSIELTREGIRLRGKDIRTIATELASIQSSGPQIVATDEIEITAKSVQVFGESSRLSLTKVAALTGESTLLTGGGAGLGLAGMATLSGSKVVVAGEGGTLVLDAEAKLDGAMVKLNCGGEGGGVSVEEREPRLLVTPKHVKRKPLRLRALDQFREPIRSKPFVLTVAGEKFESSTDDNGILDVQVLEHATLGKLEVWPDGDFPSGARLRWRIEIEALPPANLPLGASIRLSNLAYYRGAPVDTIDERLESAIARFQLDRGLSVTRQLDPFTVLTLMKLHGH